MENFNDSNVTSYDKMFDNVPDNIVICMHEQNYKILSKLKEKRRCYNISCIVDWRSNQRKIINTNGNCVAKCEDDEQFKYEYNGKCYENCPNGYLKDDNNNVIHKCKCELEKCLSCPPVAKNKQLCTECNTNYYPVENDPKNVGEYINCYNETPIDGYYLDKDQKMYKKCYYTCKTCEKKGNNINHNCLECHENFSFSFDFTNYLNCFENCNYYFYFDDNYSYHCTSNLSCPNDFPILTETNECIHSQDTIKSTEIIDEKLIPMSSGIIFRKEFITTLIETQKCFENVDIKNVIEDIVNHEKNKTEIKNKTEEIQYYDTIIDTIENIFTSPNFDTSNIDNGIDEMIKTEKLTITLTTTKNQINNIFNNITLIDLGECEGILRKFYHISDNENIYMKKTEIVQEGMKIPKIEYDVYCRLSGSNLTRLNLTLCRNNKISLSIPIVISENPDILNTSSGYYNNICYKASSDSGTDITLNDRKTEFVEGDKTICQEDCDFSEYDSGKQKANCSCKIKESSDTFENMNINKTKLYENFEDTNNKY